MPNIIYSPIKYLCHKATDAPQRKARSINSSASVPELVIYCIHGTASYPKTFDELSSQLRQLLNIYYPELSFAIRVPAFTQRFTGRSVQDYSTQLESEIVNNNDHNKPLIFIGHSRGGLICCYIALTGKYNILSVITIATPFKGTKIPTIPMHLIKFSTSIKQMLQCHKFLEELCQQLKNISFNLIHYVGDNDNVISAQSAHPTENIIHEISNLIILKKCGHSSILKSPELALSIINELSGYLENKIYRSYIINLSPF